MTDAEDIGERLLYWMTFTIGEELGYGSLFDYCKENLDCDRAYYRVAIPAGYKRVQNRFQGTIVLGKEAAEYLDKIVKKYTDKGLEVPYYLLGTSQEKDGNISVLIDKVVSFFDEHDLNYCEAIFPEHITEQVKSEISSGKYNVVVVGHSHPALTGSNEDTDPKFTNLFNYLRTVKTENDYRDGNLNMTFMDIHTLVLLTMDIRSINKSAITMGCIYHDNGELNFTYCDGEYYLGLATDVYKKLDNGSLEPVTNFDTNEIRKVR